jgi:hypothetical protein
MKVITLGVLLIGLSFSTAFAQNYRLEFHSDEALASCELAVNSPGFIKVYVVVTGQGGPLGGVSFLAPRPPCMRSAVWLADAWQIPPVRSYYHNTQSPDHCDLIIDCALAPPATPTYLPVYLGLILFYVTEPVDPCCMYGPTAPIYHADPFLIMCTDFGDRAMTPRPVVMNPTASCRCDLPLPARESTWGSVKALYR